MSGNKTNVIDMNDFAYKKGKSAHADDVVRYNELSPIELIVQNHLNNIRNTYGDNALRQVVIVLGLDKQAVDKAS